MYFYICGFLCLVCMYMHVPEHKSKGQRTPGSSQFSFPLCGQKDCKNLPLKKKKKLGVVVVHAFNPSRGRQDKWISVSLRPQGSKEKPCLKKTTEQNKKQMRQRMKLSLIVDILFHNIVHTRACKCACMCIIYFVWVNRKSIHF